MPFANNSNLLTCCYSIFSPVNNCCVCLLSVNVPELYFLYLPSSTSSSLSKTNFPSYIQRTFFLLRLIETFFSIVYWLILLLLLSLYDNCEHVSSSCVDSNKKTNNDFCKKEERARERRVKERETKHDEHRIIGFR